MPETVEWPGQEWKGKEHSLSIDEWRAKPWGFRFRFAEPQRTYSGKVVYHRSKHLFSEKDLRRITERVIEVKPPDADNWVYELLRKYWQIFYDFYRPAFAALGIGNLYDFVATYTFDRAWDLIEGNIVDPIADALSLIEAANSGLPIEERLALITQQDYDTERNGFLDTIQELEDRILYLEGELAKLEASVWLKS